MELLGIFLAVLSAMLVRDWLRGWLRWNRYWTNRDRASLRGRTYNLARRLIIQR